MFDSAADLAEEKRHKKLRDVGVMKITSNDGRVDEAWADREDFYKEHGFCQRATKPMFMVDGFATRKPGGFYREKILYRNGERIILTREEM